MDLDIRYVLILLFIGLLFYYINSNKNKIISYQTIKQFKIMGMNNNQLNNLKNKYKRSNCNDYCSPELCNKYQIELNNYKKCLKCQKEFKCYNVYTDKCENCISLGIGQCNMPINPKNNLCK